MEKEKTKKIVKAKTKTKKVVKSHGKVVTFLMDVKKEMGKVRWPNRKEMTTYSIATIVFVIFFALFFSLNDIILSGIKMVLK
ncbi:MAG: preprotein translocase subunit SecE [Bacilli bacterium]|nr:preprotein translocase subunit SecE [Bacilli bacterium]